MITHITKAKYIGGSFKGLVDLLNQFHVWITQKMFASVSIRAIFGSFTYTRGTLNKEKYREEEL